MKSGKQRRAELQVSKDAKRKKKEAAQAATEARRRKALLKAKEKEGVAVNVANLSPYNSYGRPAFAERGYYVDIDFTCQGCGSAETWTAAQQKWWYEVAKGYVYSGATRCRACRRRERERKATGKTPALPANSARKKRHSG